MRKLIYILFLFLISCKSDLKKESELNLRLSILFQEKKNNDIYIDIKKALVENGSKPTDIQFLKPFFNYCSNKVSKSDSLHFLDKNISLLNKAVKNTPEFILKDSVISNLNNILNAYQSKELSFELCYNHFLLIEKQYFDFLSSYMSYNDCGFGKIINVNKNKHEVYLNEKYEIVISYYENSNTRPFILKNLVLNILDNKKRKIDFKITTKSFNQLVFITIYPTSKGEYFLNGIYTIKHLNKSADFEFNDSFKVL